MALLHTDWWLTDYPEEINTHLRLKESTRKPFRARSPQIGTRSHLVEWLSRVCEKHQLSTIVKHLAVFYLDRFMDAHSIEIEQLHLVSLGCLLVAAKSEEKDILIPKPADLNKSADDHYRVIEFFQMEIVLLEFFHWDLVIPTAAHFFEYYSHYLLIESDLAADSKIFSSYAELQIYAKRYSDYFLESSIRDTVFLQFPGSLVAAACIAACRICLQVSPCWPVRLRKVTNYPGEALCSCVELFIRYLETDEEELNANN